MIDFLNINLPDWVNWIARDASGVWWGYQAEPLQNHRGWYENEVGQIIELTSDAPNTEWRNSLQKLS